MAKNAKKRSNPVSAPRRQIDKWEVSSAASTLIEAEKIRNDPQLMKAAKKELNKQEKAIKEAKKG